MIMAEQKSSYVDPYPGRKGSDRIVEDCGRCGGDGLYVGPTNATFFTATVGDTAPGCFACRGTGKYSFLVSSARAKARRHARDAAAAAERVAEIKARTSAFRAKHGPVANRAVEVQESLRDGDPISRRLRELLDDLQGSALDAGFDDDAWAERAAAALAEFDKREATKRPVPTGRVEMSGIVLSAKYVDGDYGSTLKMLVEGDGWKVWGSVPKNVADDVYAEFYEGDRDRSLDGVAVWTKDLIGRRVTFTATVKASEEDSAFGFFSRPTKASIAARDLSAGIRSI